MKIESVDFVEWDAKQVYPLVRDHIEKIVPFMLNIEKIERMVLQKHNIGRPAAAAEAEEKPAGKAAPKNGAPPAGSDAEGKKAPVITGKTN